MFSLQGDKIEREVQELKITGINQKLYDLTLVVTMHKQSIVSA